MADGQPREAIIYTVNLGRDTDCKAYVADGLAGTLMICSR
jgi:ADP-ribosylglycohydrolase